MSAAKPKAGDPRKIRRTLDSIIRYTSSIGENTAFNGTFTGGENIVVRGKVTGKSDVQGAVVITETGRWIGELSADVVVVHGFVQGDITAREKIEMSSGARVEGNLRCPVIAMETGAVHEGHISMHSNVSSFVEKREAAQHAEKV